MLYKILLPGLAKSPQEIVFPIQMNGEEDLLHSVVHSILYDFAGENLLELPPFLAFNFDRHFFDNTKNMYLYFTFLIKVKVSLRKKYKLHFTSQTIHFFLVILNKK